MEVVRFEALADVDHGGVNEVRLFTSEHGGGLTVCHVAVLPSDGSMATMLLTVEQLREVYAMMGRFLEGVGDG